MPHETWLIMIVVWSNIGCTKVIAPVSSSHNGFGNAHRSMFPTSNETAGIHVLIAFPPLSSGLWHHRKEMATPEQKAFVCCSLRSKKQLFSSYSCSAGLQATISEWFPHLSIALGICVSSFSSLCNGKCAERPHVRRKRGMSETVFSLQFE
jgi:hypothetical protein